MRLPGASGRAQPPAPMRPLELKSRQQLRRGRRRLAPFDNQLLIGERKERSQALIATASVSYFNTPSAERSKVRQLAHAHDNLLSPKLTFAKSFNR